MDSRFSLAQAELEQVEFFKDHSLRMSWKPHGSFKSFVCSFGNATIWPFTVQWASKSNCGHTNEVSDLELASKPWEMDVCRRELCTFKMHLLWQYFSLDAGEIVDLIGNHRIS